MTDNADKPLKLETKQIGSAVVVRIGGSVGIVEADQLYRKLEELASSEASIVILDLSEMDFICSSGLGAIISGHVKSRRHQGQFKLVSPQPAVRRLLETTRLTKLFPLYDTVDQALRE